MKLRDCRVSYEHGQGYMSMVGCHLLREIPQQASEIARVVANVMVNVAIANARHVKHDQAFIVKSVNKALSFADHCGYQKEADQISAEIEKVEIGGHTVFATTS